MVHAALTVDSSLRARLRPFFLCFSAIVSLSFVVWVVLAPIEERPAKQAVCTSPPIRREWRALTLTEKHDFISAIQCISKTPSARDGNLTIYDDIAVLHGGIGSWCKSRRSSIRKTHHPYYSASKTTHSCNPRPQIGVFSAVAQKHTGGY